MSWSRLAPDRSLSERPSIVVVSCVTSGGADASFIDCIRVPEDPPDVSDVKGRVRLDRIPRSIVPLASMNLGNENVPVTVIPKLISANAHKPSQAVL